MKRLVTIFSLLALITPFISAQKQYTRGEPVFVDGVRGLVVSTADDGTVATVMTLCNGEGLVTDADPEAAAEAIRTNTALTPEQREMALSAIDPNATISVLLPEVPREKNGSKAIYHVDQWASKVPAGWHLPNSDEAEAIATLIYGGLGKKHSVKLNKLQEACHNATSDPLWRSQLHALAGLGFLTCPDNDPANVRFVSRNTKGLSCFFEIADRFSGNEMTVAVITLGR